MYNVANCHFILFNWSVFGVTRGWATKIRRLEVGSGKRQVIYKGWGGIHVWKIECCIHRLDVLQL